MDPSSTVIVIAVAAIVALILGFVPTFPPNTAPSSEARRTITPHQRLSGPAPHGSPSWKCR
jgi:hypothetical protein